MSFINFLLGSFSGLIRPLLPARKPPRSGWTEHMALEELVRGLKHPERLGEAPKKNGSPHTIIVTGAGLRAADLVRSVRRYQKKGNAIAKLFAKHIKIEESVQFLQSHRTGMAVGTPKRLNDLVENESVTMKHTGILFVHVLLANMLQTSLAADLSPPSMLCKTFGVFTIIR
ncbi:hypothetical protein DL770_010953 [Monosporascus sp. CRB-9-2]|nr:hypothetical protein DL770_010953 [Monosporascus sp. CRB-9-2]